MPAATSFLAAGLALAGTATAAATAGSKACKQTTLLTSPPSSGNVAMQSYSYCGGNLNATAYVTNLDYDKIVTLYYTDKEGKSTPLSAVGLGYNYSVANTNWQVWGTVVPIFYDGITELLNITYQATDVGQTYNQILNKKVTASGAPAPSVPQPPKPYATPLGLGSDVTSYLAAEHNSEAGIAMKRMFLNINPPVPGAVNGTIVAARSGPFWNNIPDYEYNWVRDSSLTQWVTQSLYAAATNKAAQQQYETIMFQYAGARAQEQIDPNLQTGLGEPKFYLNNTIFSGPWGRPQNDGAATSAVTLMTFANQYLANGGSKETVLNEIYNSTANPSKAPVMKDLLFVARNWSSPSFDLWEEEESDQFYTRFVQRRALIVGAAFAKSLGDDATAATLETAESELTATLSQFWDPNRQIILYEYGPVLHGKTSYLDTAIVLALIHGYADDGVYSYTNPKILSTAVRVATSFIDVFPLANQTRLNKAGQILGIPVGRYPEDIYNGTGTGLGNPWFLCTAAFSQFMYQASMELTEAKTLKVTKVSQVFWDYFAPTAKLQAGKSYSSSTSGFKAAIQSLNGWGDAFIRTIQYYAPSDGHLTEEYSRFTGVPVGAQDLTWSYASVLTAAIARAQLTGDKEFLPTLANFGVKSNN